MRTRWIVVLTGSLAVLAGVLVWVVAGSVLGWTSRPAPPSEPGVDFAVTDTYAVADGILSPAPDRRAAEVWDEFVRVVTPEYAAAEVVEYRTGDDPASDTLAYVSRETDPHRWVFAANLAYADDPDLLLSTLVHEYAHLLSLGPDDVGFGAGQCETLWTVQGCATPDADVWAFQRAFWDRYPDAPAPDNDDPAVTTEFFDRHEDDFVSAYAATSVTEDFAESFLASVLEAVPTADGVIADKVRFFHDRPEYAAARDRIRAEFGLG